MPSLGAVPLRTASSASDAIVLPVWTGLGVLQLEVYVERELPSSKRAADSPRGVVFALVNTPGDPESAATMRMWSLTSLVNLAKWRCFNEVRTLSGSIHTLMLTRVAFPVVRTRRHATSPPASCAASDRRRR